MPSAWSSSKPKALFLGVIDKRDEEESLLGSVYAGLVCRTFPLWKRGLLKRCSFSAALLGLPKLMNENDIEAEYPLDIDDENVSERGFQSTLPGESTRLSSALALFRVARILSKVLNEVYPSTSSHELSLQKIGALNDELGVWLQSLAPHHRLQFVQDKPSTDVVGSRSPLLVRYIIRPRRNM